LLSDRDLRAAMGGRGARYAAEHLDIRRPIERIARAYRAMAQQGRASAEGGAIGAV
jgi:glycosyltransferase involved in cell wall biosynthesis